MALPLLILACSSDPAPEPSAAPPVAPAPAAQAPDPPRSPSGRIGGEPILDRPVVLGAIPNEAVEATVAEHLGGIRACLASSGGAGRMGKVLVKFSIAPDGAVRDPSVRATSLRHPATEGCVLAAVSQIRFPALSSGAIALVQYPFSFP